MGTALPQGNQEEMCVGPIAIGVIPHTRYASKSHGMELVGVPTDSCLAWAA